MNEQLFLRYQDNFTKIINERYHLDNKIYNFDDYNIEDFKLCNLDFYYKDGRPCKILDYDWAGDGKYDLHELLALWNRGLEHKSFAELLGSYFVDSERLADKHEELRHIGIEIECNNLLYGKDKNFCPYPLKLVRDLAKNKNLKYNDIQNISISDPMQGFERMTNDEYVLEHCFGDKDYFEYMEVEYESIFD